jgi:uncharacterized protein with HEPN domain
MPRDETYLLYMLLAAKRIARSVAGLTREQFDADLEKMDSVALQLGNIGEAAGHVSSAFRQQHPEIPWPKMTGMRHRIFHQYLEIDWNIVWVAATGEAPDLIRALEPLVPPEDSL